MKRYTLIIILLVLTVKQTFSQNLLITEVQRDSIVSKILRGNQAQEENVVLKKQIIVKDSVIAVCSTVISIQKNSINLQQQQLNNSLMIIKNQKEIISNEKKRARKKGFSGFLKGVGVGAALVVGFSFL